MTGQGEGGAVLGEEALPPKWSETNTERAAWLLNPTRPSFCGEPIQDSGCRYCKPRQCNWSLAARARADGAAEERERIARHLEFTADASSSHHNAAIWRAAAQTARSMP